MQPDETFEVADKPVPGTNEMMRSADNLCTTRRLIEFFVFLSTGNSVSLEYL